jgi:DNA-binding NarL/FixJ family response regulator
VNPTVAIVDDQQEMRRALRTIIEADGLVVVGEAGDGDGAVSLASAARPDVMLMDVRMPGRDGVSATGIVRSLSPAPRVLVLTTFDDDDAVASALAAGASGFLLKTCGSDALVRAIRLVADGEVVLDELIAPRVLRSFVARRTRPADVERFESLTPREREVLAMLCQGRTNQEIGTNLFIGEATAKTHVSRIIAKLGVRDRVQAVIRAYEAGFLDPT